MFKIIISGLHLATVVSNFKCDKNYCIFSFKIVSETFDIE